MTFVREEGAHRGIQRENWCSWRDWVGIGYLLPCLKWLWTFFFIFKRQIKWYYSEQDGSGSLKVNISSMAVTRQKCFSLKSYSQGTSTEPGGVLRTEDEAGFYHPEQQAKWWVIMTKKRDRTCEKEGLGTRFRFTCASLHGEESLRCWSRYEFPRR